MSHSIPLTRPIFEIGLKAYWFGRQALEFAQAADEVCARHDAAIIITPQYVDIPSIARKTKHLLVFAQHIDDITPGKGNGSVLAEAVKEAGAHGTWLNHAESPLTLGQIQRCVARAKEVGLYSLVSSDSPQQAAAVSNFNPDIIAAEPPELIDRKDSIETSELHFIAQTRQLLQEGNSRAIFFYGAGIRTPVNVRNVIHAGAEGTGTTSGIVKAKNPVQMLEDMIIALKDAWNRRNN